VMGGAANPRPTADGNRIMRGSAAEAPSVGRLTEEKVKTTHLILMLILVSVAVEAGLAAQDTSGKFDAAGLEEPEVRDFFSAFQQGVLSRRAHQVVDLIEFPLRVNDCNRTKYIGRRDFDRRFSYIFDAQVSKAVKEQTFDTLAASWRGVMIGDHGEVWFEGICEGSTEANPCPKHRIRVISVNKDCP
jgi:hypothetical protein